MSDTDPQKDRKLGLDLLRIGSILVLVWFHATIDWGHKSKFIIHVGTYVVRVFIVLSGFGLAMSMASRKHSWGEYFRRRILRIYPPYLFLLAMILSFNYLSGNLAPIRPWTIPLSVLGLDGYFSRFIYFNENFTFFGSEWVFTPAYRIGEWFLGLILVLYILFPPAYLTFKRLGSLPAYGAILLFAFGCHKLVAWLWPGIQIRHFPIAWPLAMFATGIALAFQQGWPRGKRAAGFLAVLIGYVLLSPSGHADMWDIGYISLFFLAANIGGVAKGRAYDIIKGLSKLSYGAFLAHHQLIYALMPHFKSYGSDNNSLMAAVFILSYAVAWMLYRALGIMASLYRTGLHLR